MGGGHRVKSLICEEFQEDMGGVDSKGGPKGKLFAFLDQERGGCQGPKVWPIPWLWGLTVWRGMLLEQRRALYCVLELLGQTLASQKCKGRRDK
jgi:hypothetical protein